MLSFLRHPKTNAAANTSFNPNGKRIHKHAFLLLLPFFAILAQAPFVAVRGQQRGPILVVRVLPATICSSSSPALVNVVFIGTSFNEGNVFTALLSGPGILLDTIGTLNSDGGLLNILHAKIPANTPAGRYRIRVIASNPGQESENAAPLTIIESKTPALTLSKRDVSSCGDGSDGSITGVATGGERPYTFRLLGGFGNREPTTDSSLTVNNLGPLSNYTMRVTDGNGCIVQADTDLVQLPAPSIEVSTQGNESACGTNNGFFTLRVFPRTGIIATAIKPYSFQMSEQGDSAGVAYEEQNPVVRFDGLSDGSAYMVTMKDGAGCKSNTIDDIAIGKDEAIVPVLGGYQKPSSCTAADGNITIKPTGGSGNSQRYSISENGGAYGPEQTGRRFGGIKANTPYTVMVKDSRGCTGTLNVTLTKNGCTDLIAGSTDGLSAATALNALKLQALPNPSRTTFTLNLQGGSKENVQIIVTDMLGKKIYQTTGSSNRQYTFGQEFKSGIYIVQVIQGKQIQTLKLVKAN